MTPPDWVDWQNISQRHRYVQFNDETVCGVCGNGPDSHWYPRINPKKLLDEVEQIADDYNRKLLE
jgi:hypothetical protein